MTKNYKPAEAAELLATSTDRVRDLILAGELAAVDIRAPGSRRATWRIPADALDRWIASRSTQKPARPQRRRRRSEEYTPKYL